MTGSCSMLKTLERYEKCSYGSTVEDDRPSKELEV